MCLSKCHPACFILIQSNKSLLFIVEKINMQHAYNIQHHPWHHMHGALESLLPDSVRLQVTCGPTIFSSGGSTFQKVRIISWLVKPCLPHYFSAKWSTKIEIFTGRMFSFVGCYTSLYSWKRFRWLMSELKCGSFSRLSSSLCLTFAQ